MRHAAFAGVVAGLAVILAEQLFPGTVCSRGDGGLSCASLDLCCVKMVKSDDQSPPDCSAALWVLTASITMPLDFRHGEDALYKGEELDFAQHLHQRGHTFDSRTAGDQAMRPRSAFSLFVILLPVAKALVLVLLPHELLFGFGFLGFKFFEFRAWLVHSDDLLHF